MHIDKKKTTKWPFECVLILKFIYNYSLIALKNNCFSAIATMHPEFFSSNIRALLKTSRIDIDIKRKIMYNAAVRCREATPQLDVFLENCQGGLKSTCSIRNRLYRKLIEQTNTVVDHPAMMRSAAQSATMISSMWLKGVMLKILENSNVSIIKDDFKQFQNIPRGDYALTLLACLARTIIKN